MHRVAVEVRHWMSDAQFADMFAIAQLSPGPNVLIVTVVTFTMCGPSAVVAHFVSDTLTRSSQSIWPAILQAALVPAQSAWMLVVGGILGFAGIV